eukprot:762359-Alexandrium_andersonii.AAC.1
MAAPAGPGQLLLTVSECAPCDHRLRAGSWAPGGPPAPGAHSRALTGLLSASSAHAQLCGGVGPA